MLYGTASPPVFDGTLAECFIVLMTNDVENAKVKRIAPGVAYTFIFHQDGAGGYRFQWPNNCLNASPVDPTPGATTVQNFIGTTGGYLQANLAATWKET